MSHSPWQKLVREQMARHGWDTQAAFAEAAGLPPASVSQWLNPKRKQRPSIENCRLAAEAFGLPLLRILVDAEVLTPEEAGTTLPTEITLAGATLNQVVNELQLRFRKLEAEIGELRSKQHPDAWRDIPLAGVNVDTDHEPAGK